ncbi:unnamed protein product [Oikopleura dioica]|uniref:DNA-directed RNA polymerase n=1 Tax=Oikopleura dioica TaxID=34765 RepID=E4YCE8_OIKDI|nr:unnamed protein product [Oikopleura dioica]
MRRRANLGGESNIVRSWPNRISFKTYSKDEIIKLSVKEITECELVYEDRDAGAKTAQLNGLHDPALGPLNRGDRCTTCNSTEKFCPGHCGHINLPSPVINPAFFTTLKMLLSASCPDCSHFLCTEKALITLQAKLVCLNSGRMDIFNEIDRETKDHYGAEKDTEGATADDNLSHGTKSKTLDELQEFLKVKTAPIDLESRKDMNRSTVFHKRDIVNIFMEYFRKKIKKCPRCLTAIPSIKFESAGGVTRVYLELEKKRAKSAPSADVTLQRVPTNMLFKQVKKLFQTERETCDLLFDGTGYEAFFIETVLVPPNCFRRMNKSGQKVLASDRTAMLQKILESSKKIKNLEMALQQLVNIHIDSNIKEERSLPSEYYGQACQLLCTYCHYSRS